MTALLGHMECACAFTKGPGSVRGEKQVPRWMLAASARNDIKMLFQQSV